MITKTKRERSVSPPHHTVAFGIEDQDHLNGILHSCLENNGPVRPGRLCLVWIDGHRCSMSIRAISEPLRSPSSGVVKRRVLLCGNNPNFGTKKGIVGYKYAGCVLPVVDGKVVVPERGSYGVYFHKSGWLELRGRRAVLVVPDQDS